MVLIWETLVISGVEGETIYNLECVELINRATLTIRNILLSDEGQYYCTVTNEWGNSVSTGNITLTVKGVCMHTINARCT